MAPSPTPAEAARRRNLATVLGLVHREREILRSRLTALTGLNRSTVGDLVGELVELGLVVEAVPEAGSSYSVPGRPSPVVRPDPRVVAVAVNPELDAITAGVVGFGGAVLERERQPTRGRTSPAEMLDATAAVVASLVARLDSEHRVAGIGVAVPGLVRASDGLVRNAPHLGWREEPFAARLAERLGRSVVAANDASLGMRAESTFGAGRGSEHLVYLNGGASGIGGGILSDGAPLAGVDGYAGEIGHTLVTPGGAVCHCGATGCLESEVRRERLLRVLEIEDADDDELERALLTGTSGAVRSEVNRQLTVLALALGNVVNTLNPGLIVLGGFLSALHASAPDTLESLLTARGLSAPRESVRVVRAELGANRLLIGAAELAFDRVLSDPARYTQATSRAE